MDSSDDSVQEELGACAVGAADSRKSPKRRRSGYVTFSKYQQKSSAALAQDFGRHLSMEGNTSRGQSLEMDNSDDNVQEELGACAVGAADSRKSPKRRRSGYVTFSKYQQKSSAALALDFGRHLSMEGNTSQRHTSEEETLETPLGSLDRTEVSLGESDVTTATKKFIREEWGTQSTMHKIYRRIKSGSTPVDVHSLVSEGPVISGQRRLIAARCFTSILKLKQHGFIKIQKDSETLEIKNIEFGDKILNGGK